MSTTQVVGPVTLRVAAATDVGLRRHHNEDAVLAAAPVFLVADGMGGYEAGDRASAAVVDAFVRVFAGRPVADLDALRDALSLADEGVAAVAEGTDRGAGSTVAGAALVPDGAGLGWVVFNVGDSRVYLVDRGELRQVTVDHSLGQELFDRGELTAQQLADFPNRNVITRAIGAPDATADSWALPVVTGQRLLICSDGLTGEVADSWIATRLARGGDLDLAVADLVAAALAAGGRDNVSVVIVEVVAGGTEDYPEPGPEPEDTAEPADDTVPGTPR